MTNLQHLGRSGPVMRILLEAGVNKTSEVITPFHVGTEAGRLVLGDVVQGTHRIHVKVGRLPFRQFDAGYPRVTRRLLYRRTVPRTIASITSGAIQYLFISCVREPKESNNGLTVSPRKSLPDRP